MRYLVFLRVLCLLITGTATAVTVVNPRLATTISLRELADVTCSSDTFADSPGANIIWVVYLSGYGDTYIDGQGKMPMWADTLGGKPGFQYPVSIGMHSVVVFKPGYTNYTAKVQVCNGTVSYVYYDQAAHVPTTTTVPATTATTVVPSATVTTVPATTLSVTAGETTTPGTMSAVSPSPTAGTGSSQDTTGTLSVATTPAGAFIFIDGVQRGVSPASIPGLSAGTHTLLLKRDGYQDLSIPVVITAGKTAEYASALPAAPAATAAATPVATGTRKASAPVFGAIIAVTAIAAMLRVEKTRR